MLNAAEGRDGFVTDPLRRRIRADQFGVFLFNRLQLPHQSIVFGVRDLRVVKHVIPIVVMPNLIFERIELIESSGRLCHCSCERAFFRLPGCCDGTE